MTHLRNFWLLLSHDFYVWVYDPPWWCLVGVRVIWVPLLKRHSWLDALAPFWKTKNYKCGSISVLSILFHWSIYWASCPYYTVSITVVLSLKVRRPSILFFFKIVLSILGPLNFHINFRVSLVIVGIMTGIFVKSIHLRYDERNVWYF